MTSPKGVGARSSGSEPRRQRIDSYETREILLSVKVFQAVIIHFGPGFASDTDISIKQP